MTGFLLSNNMIKDLSTLIGIVFLHSMILVRKIHLNLIDWWIKRILVQENDDNMSGDNPP